jgi:antitoxin Xre/MbcA/ParS-like protein
LKRIEPKPDTDLAKKRKREGTFGRPPATGPIIAHATPIVADRTADDPVRDKILEIIARKTGYPKDMLDLDLNVEAELGIGADGWAAMLAVIRSEYNIPPDEILQPRDFPTLAHVIKFVWERQVEIAGEQTAGRSAGQRESRPERATPTLAPASASTPTAPALSVNRRHSDVSRSPYFRVDAQTAEYAQVLAHAVDTFGSRTNANAWLNKPNRAFHNQTPLQILTQDPAAVEEELVRIDHGMFL